MSLRLFPDGAAVAGFEPRPFPFPPALSRLLVQFEAGFAAEGIPVQARLAMPGAGERGPAVTLRWALGNAEGELTLPARMADRLLRAVEPAPQGAIDGATAALLLELALAEPLGRLDAACGEAVRLVELVPAASAPNLADFAVGIAGLFDGEPFVGTLRLPETAPLERLAASLPGPASRVDPPVALTVRLGLARLDAHTLRSLEAGDAVLLQQPGEGRVAVVAGEHLAALGRLDGSRVILEAAPARAANIGMGIWTMNENADADAKGVDVGPPNGSLEELQVTLVFELARQPATLQEVQALAPGDVIELGPLAEQRVSVLANGARIGQGEIVRVGDAAAVRLTRIAAA